MKRKSGLRRKASSLVITLMVIAVLSIIVVAFLQSMTIERKTAASYSNILKARLAAEAGIEQAVARIQSTLPTNNPALTNGFIVWSWGMDTNFNTSYTGILTNIFDTAGSAQGVDRTVWLFSSLYASNAIQYNPTWLSTAASNSCNMNGSISASGYHRITSATNAIAVDWLTLTNLLAPNSSITNQTIRTAYWVSDEGGRLPVTAIGNAGNTTINSGKLTDLEISGLSNSEVSAVIANRPNISALGGRSYQSIAASTTNSPNSFSTVSKNLSGRINYGGFFMQPRTNINSLFANSANATTFVTDFSALLQNGLPDYYNRKESFGGTVKRIAASIYDYISSSSTATMSPDLTSYFANFTNITGPWTVTTNTYYGIEAVPRLNEYLCYYGTASSATNQYIFTPTNITLGVTRTFELWNMSQKTDTLTGISFRVFNHQGVSIFGGDTIPYPEETIAFTNTIVIPPNNFYALTHTKEYVTAQTGSTLTNFNNFRSLIPKATGMGVIVSASVNGEPVTVIDAAAKMELQNTPSAGKAGNNPGYSGSAQLADGRINMLQTLTKWANVTGSKHTPGLPNNKSGAEYQIMLNWFDRPLVGGAQNKSPLTAPNYIKNGPLDYIGELGSIWDPSPDITDGNSANVQGGKTLVVGQFDPYYRIQSGVVNATYADYSSYMKRADCAILDLFTVNNDARFNINSPRPLSETNRPLAVLANTFDGITNSMFPQTTKPVYNGAAFEAAVVSRLATPVWTNARPIRNMADLTTLGATTANLQASPVVGTNTFWSLGTGAFWKSGAPGTVQVNSTSPLSTAINVVDGDDRSREEAFRRVANFIDFSSLAFRVYAAGQVLDRNNRQQARVNLMAIVTFTPTVTTNPSTGETTSVTYTPNIQTTPID